MQSRLTVDLPVKPATQPPGPDRPCQCQIAHQQLASIAILRAAFVNAVLAESQRTDGERTVLCLDQLWDFLPVGNGAADAVPEPGAVASLVAWMDAHMRTCEEHPAGIAIRERDDLRARLAAGAKRWKWEYLPRPDHYVLRFCGIDAAEISTICDVVLHNRCERIPHANLPAALATIRAVLGADVPGLPRSES